MPKFRKKPVVIEAVQFNGNNYIAIENFVSKLLTTGRSDNGLFITIPTLEGDMKASKDDWIIKGVNGEFYPCKPDIFEKTYKSVE